ncbi:MAG: nuclear transport factor 2 family protein [Stagnimonas sp.]|nr:nuclear transport factor 2 family protein [Stagnimonas sp.]
MSDTQANKDVCTRLFERFSAGDVPGVLDLMADDATWWLPGKPGQLPVVGTRTKAQIAKLFHAMESQLEGPLKMTVKGAIAEGDQVAMEVESLGRLRNGRTYNQEYHFRITVQGGKIAAVREYLDTLHVQAVWFAA